MSCSRQRSDMTPCIVEHGESARADDGACVGCGVNVPVGDEIEAAVTRIDNKVGLSLDGCVAVAQELLAAEQRGAAAVQEVLALERNGRLINLARLRGVALVARRALNELGVPGPEYPAPVANAVDCLKALLHSLEEEPHA